MADTTQVPAPLSRTVFPFPKSRGANGQAGEANAQEYFQALSQAEDGFFPIGYNGQWHGGIHFGSQTGASLDQDGGIRCIADGQVIAYRIDREYPKVDYESCAAATYSRGFVLVRHRLQLPRAPQAAGEEAEAPSNTSGEPSLLFYSLYMHLRNSEAYAADPGLRRPGFWDGSIHLVGERALDNSGNPFIPEAGVTGMNIRDEAHAIAGFAPRGVKLRLGEPHQTRGSYFRITEVVEGTTYPAEVVGMYVYKGTDTSREGLDAIASPHATDSVYIPPEPIDIKAGDIVGHLGEYQRYLDMDALAQCASGRPLAQVDVFTHEDLPAFVAQGRARDAQLEARQKTLLHIKPGAQLVQPSPPDIELTTGQAIYQVASGADDQWVKGRRGSVAIVDERPAGFSSTTRTYGDGRIFLAAVDAAGNEITLEQLNALRDQSTYPRRKLFTPEGDEVWVASGQANGQSLIVGPASAWSQFPLQPANPDGEPVGYSRVLPISEAAKTVQEADGTRWFHVDVGTRSGTALSGWVRESGHHNVELCSPWAWPGFELFDVGELEPRELFARELNSSRRSQPQEREEFENTARNIEQSRLFDALAEAIDSDGNQQITPLELRRAMGTSWLAQAVSRLVIRYPSEWSDPSNRWSRIDNLIKDEVLLRDWQHEKNRIRQLLIWPDVAGQHGFPSGSTVHHLHPVGFVENFAAVGGCSCVSEITEDQMNSIAGDATRENIRRYTPEVNAMFRRFGMSACMNKVHLLGQMLHESGSFRYTRELGKSLSYDPWRGRGLIQVTFQQNYAAYGRFIGVDATSNQAARELLENVPHSVLSAAWYWSEYKSLDAHAEMDDFIWCTAVVNGAFNGYEHRLSFVNKAIDVLGLQHCAIKNHGGEYLFEESAVYRNRRYSFAWGLWHDPASKKAGVNKSAQKAIAGYRRYVELHGQAGYPIEPSIRRDGARSYWYGLRVPSYRDYAEMRIAALE